MPNRMIANPIINSPFEEPRRHFRFDDEGITNQIIEERRPSSYFVPIAQRKKKAKDKPPTLSDWTADRIERTLQIAVREGPAIDGITRRPEPTVDGLPFITYIQPWLHIREQLGLEGRQHA